MNSLTHLTVLKSQNSFYDQDTRTLHIPNPDIYEMISTGDGRQWCLSLNARYNADAYRVALIPAPDSATVHARTARKGESGYKLFDDLHQGSGIFRERPKVPGSRFRLPILVAYHDPDCPLWQQASYNQTFINYLLKQTGPNAFRMLRLHFDGLRLTGCCLNVETYQAVLQQCRQHPGQDLVCTDYEREFRAVTLVADILDTLASATRENQLSDKPAEELPSQEASSVSLDKSMYEHAKRQFQQLAASGYARVMHYNVIIAAAMACEDPDFAENCKRGRENARRIHTDDGTARFLKRESALRGMLRPARK